MLVEDQRDSTDGFMTAFRGYQELGFLIFRLQILVFEAIFAIQTYFL
jgi:hypothetical protein